MRVADKVTVDNFANVLLKEMEKYSQAVVLQIKRAFDFQIILAVK